MNFEIQESLSTISNHEISDGEFYRNARIFVRKKLVLNMFGLYCDFNSQRIRRNRVINT